MSSILKALKKLESEAPPRTEDAAPSLQRAMNVRRTIHDRFQKARLIRGLLLTLAGITILTAGAWLYLNRRQLPIVKEVYPGGEIARSVSPPPDWEAQTVSPPSPAPVPETPVTTADQRPAPEAERPPPPEPERLASVSEAPAVKRPIQGTPAPRNPPTPKKPPARTPVRTHSSEPAPARPKPTETAAKSEISRPPETAPVPPPAAASPKPEPPPAPAPADPPPPTQTAAASGSSGLYASLAQRSDPRFHIQALVWSPDTAGRMAMINGNIVKTGGVVGDARILHIGENFLVFQEKGNRWRQPFRVK